MEFYLDLQDLKVGVEVGLGLLEEAYSKGVHKASDKENIHK